MAHDERHARAIHELGNTSGIVVPLVARGRTFGAITFGTVPPLPPFTANDLELAVEIGRRASAGARQRAPLRGGAGPRARGRGARVRRRRRLLVDREEIVRLLNPAAARTFAVKPAKAIGRRIDKAGARVADRARPHPRSCRPRSRARGARDAAARGEGQRALALDLGRRLRRRHGLRVPRPDRGARGRAVEERLRLDRVARAADAARGDLRRRAHAPARRHPARGVAARPACST